MVMQQDMDLARQCRQLADTARKAGTWLQDNGDMVGGEKASLLKDMRHAGRFFSKCSQAAERKMCAGVFGPSQSGKSYLISALASDANGALLADFCGEQVDFLKKINPEGGKESTGLVTRFTTTQPEGLTPEFPIRLRLLSEMDVARVLANTYYADCDHKDAPSAEALVKTLDQLEASAPAAPVEGSLDVDDVEDLRDYVNKNFSSRPRVQMLQNGYWARAAALAPRLGLEGRARLFGLVWDEVDEFQSVYLQLCGALHSLGRAAEVNCPLDALIPRERSIIDVDRLHGLKHPTGDSLPILAPGGVKVTLPRAVITALTAEITIFMREKPDDLFDHTDLLDFPGYRSRHKFTDLREALASKEEMLKELFLRGKVAYLFERYREEKELTSMLLCIAPSSQEVHDLPHAVYEWICSTHGEKPSSRAGKAPALFFVLTKMDMEFEKKKGSSSAEARWDTRLEASLVKFFGQVHDWVDNWDGIHPFNNVFLLRNPNFTCEAIFDYNEGRESKVRHDQLAFVEEVRQSFMQSPLVQRHVASPDKVWQAAMTLNDGGVSLLRDSLRPLCNPELKRQQIRVSLDERKEQIVTRLSPFYRTDDRDELRRQKEQLSRNFVTLLAKLAEKQLFGEFLRRLQVRDYDLYELCLNARQIPEQGQTAASLQVVGTRVSADDILGDIFGESTESAPPAQENGEAQARDMAGVFASLVMEHWIARLRDFGASAEARAQLGLPTLELDQLCHEIILAASRCRLREDLEVSLRRSMSYSNIARERLIWKQVSLAADAINAFVDWLGFDPRFKNQSQRTILFGGKSVSLFDPPPVISGEPHIAEQETPYDRFWYTDWLRALAYSIMANVDFDGQQTLDPEQNNRLRDILQVFKG